jgi:uncharacterized protein
MKTFLMQCVRGYQLLLRAWLGNQCRFMPRCSDYALQALEQHGAGYGSYLATRRLMRCHPWCDGGLDPVPPKQASMTSTQAARPPDALP